MHKNGNFYSSLINAFNGLKHCVVSEKNARFHLLATLLVVVVGSVLHLSITDWLFLLLAISMVWIAELFNTAMEFLFDIVNPELNPKVKFAKDMSAAAVLIAALFSLVVGCLILIPPIYQLARTLNIN